MASLNVEHSGERLPGRIRRTDGGHESTAHPQGRAAGFLVSQLPHAGAPHHRERHPPAGLLLLPGLPDELHDLHPAHPGEPGPGNGDPRGCRRPLPRRRHLPRHRRHGFPHAGLPAFHRSRSPCSAMAAGSLPVSLQRVLHRVHRAPAADHDLRHLDHVVRHGPAHHADPRRPYPRGLLHASTGRPWQGSFPCPSSSFSWQSPSACCWDA